MSLYSTNILKVFILTQKPLTILFFEQANEAWGYQKESLLSPSFFDIEGQGSPDSSEATSTAPKKEKDLDCTKAFLDHAIGRLRYSSGDTLAAVQLFAALLKPTSIASTPSLGIGLATPGAREPSAETGAMYLADFRDALEVRTRMSVFVII